MNVGNFDRGLRALIGVILICAPLLNTPAIWTSAVAFFASIAIGAILIVTALFGVCPLYRLAGISTANS